MDTCERCGGSFTRTVGASGRHCSRACYEWRGPFTVKHKGSRWFIVDRHGDTERTGYVEQGAATYFCELLNGFIKSQRRKLEQGS